MLSRFALRWDMIGAVSVRIGAQALQPGQSAESVVMFPGSQACRTQRGYVVSLTTVSYGTPANDSRVAHPPKSRRWRHDDCHRWL